MRIEICLFIEMFSVMCEDVFYKISFEFFLFFRDISYCEIDFFFVIIDICMRL